METNNTIRPDQLCIIAQEIADCVPGFFEKKGPGAGDRATADYVRSLQCAAKEFFGLDLSEKKVCKSAGFKFDYCFPEERVAVEFAFGLHNPISEFERDVLKCLLAIDDGCPVERLILMGKPGAIARLSAPAPLAITRFVRKRFGLVVEVMELRLPATIGENAS